MDGLDFALAVVFGQGTAKWVCTEAMALSGAHKSCGCLRKEISPLGKVAANLHHQLGRALAARLAAQLLVQVPPDLGRGAALRKLRRQESTAESDPPVSASWLSSGRQPRKSALSQ